MNAIQPPLPGLRPRPSETPAGARVLRLMREHGTARMLRHAALYARQLDREVGYRGNHRREKPTR